MGRKIQRHLSWFAAAGMLASLAGCGDKTTTTIPLPGGKPVVYTVNYPLAYFAERLAGDSAKVVLPADPDEDPAFWQPNDNHIGGFQAADLILRNGATYAKWAEKVSLPASTQIDTSKVFSGDYIKTDGDATHTHGGDGDHSHAGTAFTTWMDFQQAIWQAEEVRDALIDLLPEEKTEIESRFEALADDLDAIQGEFKSIGESLAEQPLVASHPVYQYWARRYGLNLIALLWEPETVPDNDAMANLKKILADHPAKLMIWEGAPAPESVEKLKAIGVESVVVDPCGNRPGEGKDFLSVMRSNVANLKKVANSQP